MFLSLIAETDARSVGDSHPYCQNTITNLGIQGYSITISHPPMNIRSKCQRSRSQGQQMQKAIEWPTCMHELSISIECPASGVLVFK